MFPESLRWRIQIWHGLLLVMVLAGFGVATYHYQMAVTMRRLDDDLQQRVAVLVGALRRGGPPEPPPERRPAGRPRLPPPGKPAPRDEFPLSAQQAEMFGGVAAEGFYYVVWRRDGGELSRSSGAPVDVPRPEPADSDRLDRAERTRGVFRESYLITPPGECVLAGKSLESDFAALREYAWRLAGFGSAVLGLGLAGGWWVASRAIRPVDAITATARRIADGELGERIVVRRKGGELGRLATVLNETFARLEESFDRQARFTADAAHELRTPIAVILSQAQAALSRARDPAAYQRTLEACVRAARRLQTLTESLLELASLDARAELMRKERCDLAIVARECAELIQPLVDARGMTLECDLDPAPCFADPDRIAQVVTNLLSNALQFNRPERTILLACGDDGSEAFVRVHDEGEGIAPEHLPHLFERFYRADASRNRQSGGAGLGLSICQDIAKAHSGTLQVESTVGEGSTFTLRLEAAAPTPVRA